MNKVWQMHGLFWFPLGVQGGHRYGHVSLCPQCWLPPTHGARLGWCTVQHLRCSSTILNSSRAQPFPDPTATCTALWRSMGHLHCVRDGWVPKLHHKKWSKCQRTAIGFEKDVSQQLWCLVPGLLDIPGTYLLQIPFKWFLLISCDYLGCNSKAWPVPNKGAQSFLHCRVQSRSNCNVAISSLLPSG